jgi:long-chain acyl-CoA synthetase
MMAGIAAEPDVARRKMVEQAIEAGRAAVRLEQSGEPVPADLAEKLERVKPILNALRSRVGLDQCARAATGAAPIDPGILEFFQAIGIPMTEAWGMTELTCAVTGSPYDRLRNGTVGMAAPGVEVRVADDGELLVRCGCVMQGYYRDPEGTAQVLDSDGWLHTGDLGTVDEEGYFRITGRKKELIITAGGKNIAPSYIEYLLQQHPLVGQACAIGDRRPYVTALLVLDPEMAPVWARQHGLNVTSVAELAEHPIVLEEIGRAVDAANEHLARVEHVRRFWVLAGEWTPLSGELTPTLKKRRGVIVGKYATEIEALYNSPPG